jgi:hypothetical protein
MYHLLLVGADLPLGDGGHAAARRHRDRSLGSACRAGYPVLEDRIYLNTYVPTFKTRAAAFFAEAGDIPWVRFGMDDVGSKLELIRPHGMAMVVHQVRPASQLLLLLPLGHRLRSAFIKVCAYFPYPVGFQKSA